MRSQEESQFYQKLRASLKLPLSFLALLWIVHLVQHLLGLNFASYGILPRHSTGLTGVITAPLIHGSFLHLLNNSLPFLVTSVLILFFYRRVAIIAFMAIYLLTGVMVWFMAKSAFHIGLSGVVYGLVSFIFFSGVFRRSLQSMVLAMVVAFLYSGMIYGIFPTQPGVSWESHLLGGIVGTLVAFLFRNSRDPEEEDPQESGDDDYEESHFFSRDVFELTKEERGRREQEWNWTENNSLE